MSNRLTLSAAVLLVALGTAACGSTGATSSPSSAPTASPTPQGIAHPTGPDEIVLRFDESGGFVPVEFLAAHVPTFTLYGDGRVVFVAAAVPTEQPPNAPGLGQPIRTATLSEEQIQGLLEFALAEGGLANARAEYQNPLVADAPTAVFEINADGDSKTVSIMALGLDAEPGPDSAIKAAFVKLRERLANFDQGGTLASEPYVAKAYRGVLLEAAGVVGVQVHAWPWPHLTPADFKLPADQNVLQQRKRVLEPDEAAELGIDGFTDGIQAGVFFRGPDTTLYSFVLRPLLPDETE
jgi:hypothetical protein